MPSVFWVLNPTLGLARAKSFRFCRPHKVSNIVFFYNFRKSLRSFSKKKSAGICIRIAQLVFRLGEVRGVLA